MARNFGGSRQRKQWSSLPSVAQAYTADATIALTSVVFIQSRTVLRMIGSYMIHATGNVTAGEVARLAVGIGVVSTDAFAAGSSAMPDPAGELDYPWLYWAEHTVRYGATASPETGISLTGFVRESFDIRLMRKVKPRESLAFVSQYVDVSGAPGISLQLDQTRVLLGTGG